MQELKKENFDLKLRLYMTQKNGEVSIIVISYLIFHIIIEFKALRRIQSNMYDGAFICDILDVYTSPEYVFASSGQQIPVQSKQSISCHWSISKPLGNSKPLAFCFQGV